MTDSHARDNNVAKPTASRHKLYIWIGAALAGVLIAGVALVWSRESAPATTAPTAMVTANPVAEIAVSNPSDSFDWWEQSTTTGDVQFLSSTTHHEGDYSLGIVSTATQPTEVAGQLDQTVSVTSGATYTISFMVKSDNASDGAVEIRPGVEWSPVIAIPGGTYDWTPQTLDYVVPSGQNKIHFRIVVRGQTQSTLIDAISVLESGPQTQSLQNAGFEGNSGDIAVVNPTLMFAEGKGRLDIATRRSDSGSISWTVVDTAQAVVAQGRTKVANHSGFVDLSTVPLGYFQINLTATLGDKIFERSTTFAVLTPMPDSAIPSSSRFGVHLHFQGGEERIANLVDMLRFTGIGHVRSDVSWRNTEAQPGVYTYEKDTEDLMKRLSANGMNALQLPVYSSKFYDDGRTPSSKEGLQAYANFANDILTHFPAVGQDIEIYNEFDHTFNTGECGPTPSCYLDMLAATSSTIRSTNPSATIAAPGNAGMGIKFDWLQEFFDLGGLQYTDAVSAHPYIRTELPETLAGDLDRLNQMIKDKNGGVTKPIWFSEMGWSTVPNWVDDDAQANFLVRMMAVSLGHGVERVYWYEAKDSGLVADDGESNFGLFEAASSLLPNTYAPKPSGVAQAVLARQLADKTFSSSADMAHGIHSYTFGNGKAAASVLWTESESAQVAIQASGPVTVTDMFGVTSELKPLGGVIQLDLSPRAVYLNGTNTGISAE